MKIIYVDWIHPIITYYMYYLYSKGACFDNLTAQQIQDYLENKVSAEYLVYVSNNKEKIEETKKKIEELKTEMKDTSSNKIITFIAISILFAASNIIERIIDFPLLGAATAIFMILIIGYGVYSLQSLRNLYLTKLNKIATSYIDAYSPEDFRKEIVQSITDNLIITIYSDIAVNSKMNRADTEKSIYVNTLVRLLNHYNDHIDYINFKYGSNYIQNLYDEVFSRLKIEGVLEQLIVRYSQKTSN